MTGRWQTLCAWAVAVRMLLLLTFPGGDLPTGGVPALVYRAALSGAGLRESGTSPAPAETEPPASAETMAEIPELSPPTPAPEPADTPAPSPTAEVLPFTDTPGVTIKNNTSQSVDVAALTAEPLTQTLSAGGPQILIIHTHGTEAYTPAAGEEYEATDPYRTTDADRSVIRVGAALASALRKQGLSVVHDTELYDYPSYAGCYARSEAATLRWLEEYPTISVVIDVHRDAVGTDEVVYKTLAASAGSTAQVMLVVGTGENGLSHPLWRENLKLALALQGSMNALCPTLTRPIHLAPERYNQHLTTGSFILEVGTNGNTLTEALRAAELFAEAAGPVFLSLAED